jgi:hypothetical protein
MRDLVGLFGGVTVASPFGKPDPMVRPIGGT